MTVLRTVPTVLTKTLNSVTQPSYLRNFVPKPISVNPDPKMTTIPPIAYPGGRFATTKLIVRSVMTKMRNVSDHVTMLTAKVSRA